MGLSVSPQILTAELKAIFDVPITLGGEIDPKNPEILNVKVLLQSVRKKSQIKCLIPLSI